jgi:general secretion pathway protein D
MKTRQRKWNKHLGGLLLMLLCGSLQAHAQGRGGGGGGGFPGFRPFGFFNAGNNNSSSSSTYNNNGTVGTATFAVDPNTHNIVVATDSETAQQISNVIYHLERPIPQVLLNCVFLQVQHNNSSDIGIEGGYTSGGNPAVNALNTFGLSGLDSVSTNFNALGQSFSTFPSPLSTAGSGGLYQVLGSDFQATLRAIAQAGKAQVLSRPSILARDGQPAQIVVGQSVPLVTSVSYSGLANTPVNNITYTDVGIILNVTPFISVANRMVEMILQPQDSSVDPTLTQTISPGVTAPYIDVTSANTVAVTPDGQTVVIGGLMENDQSSNESKIPILGDIPVLGNLFKYKSKSDAKQELLIFVTPHIVQAPTQLADLPGGPSHLPSMITNSISEQELNRFLERLPEKQNP